MKKTTALLFVIIFSLICINCSKDEKSIQDKEPVYSERDVRNRNLKDAIKNFNEGYYKAAGSSVVNARGNRLRDEDIEIMNDLEKRVNQKTTEAIIYLELLTTEGDPREYDVTYRTIQSNYDVSSYRQKIDELNNQFLARIQKENDAYSEKYNHCIEEIKNITSPTIENGKKVFVTKTSPLSLKIVIDKFETPQFYLLFRPSQKEPELETLKISNKNTSIFFDKKDMLINEYNLSASKIITFNLLDSNSSINISKLNQLLDEDNIAINLKWFYEPERVNVRSNTIIKLKNVLTSAEKLIKEYTAIKEKIFIPQYVK